MKGLEILSMWGKENEIIIGKYYFENKRVIITVLAVSVKNQIKSLSVYPDDFIC